MVVATSEGGHFKMSLYALAVGFILHRKETQIGILRENKINLPETLKMFVKDFEGLQRLLRNLSSIMDKLLSLPSLQRSISF